MTKRDVVIFIFHYAFLKHSCLSHLKMKHKRTIDRYTTLLGTSYVYIETEAIVPNIKFTH